MSFPVTHIRTACSKNGITLAQLEKDTGIGNGVIARWENAKGTPPIDRVFKIARRLNVSIEYLMGEPETPQSPLFTKISTLDPIDLIKLEAYIDGLLSADKYAVKKESEDIMGIA